MKEFICGDCLEGMKEFPDKFFDLAIVDPPYGGGNNDATKTYTSNSRNKATKRTQYRQFHNVAPSKEYFTELFRISKQQIVWGGNFFGLKGGYLCWNKNGTAFGEAELAYCSMFNSIRIWEYTWNGMLQGDMKNKEQRIHSTQKPVQLYKWLLRNYAEPHFKILDTHVGSASSLIAFEDFGCEYVGYEIDPTIYMAASKRLAEKKAQLTIFQS